MFQKIINQCKVDKVNKKVQHKQFNAELQNTLDGSIVLGINQLGPVTCDAAALDYLLLDDIELTQAGWALHKANLIAYGIITQTDIDNEKVKPGVAARVQILKDKINKP